MKTKNYELFAIDQTLFLIKVQFSTKVLMNFKVKISSFQPGVSPIGFLEEKLVYCCDTKCLFLETLNKFTYNSNNPIIL